MLKHPRYKFIFMWIDIALIVIACLGALGLSMPSFFDFSDKTFFFYLSHVSMCLIFMVVLIMTFRFNNLYRRNIIIQRYRQAVLLLKSLIIGCSIIAIFMFVVNRPYFVFYGKNQILYFWVFSLFLFILIRALFSKRIYRLLADTKILRINVLVVGGDEAARHAANGLETDTFADFSLAGFIDDYKETGTPIYKGFQNLGKLEDLEGLIKEMQVDEILIAIDNLPYKRLIHVVETCMATKKLVRIYSNLLDIVSEKLDVEYYGNIPLITLSQQPLTGIDWQDKRIVDICVSTLALILLLPIFLMVFLGVKLSSRGSLFYKQIRIGKNGRPFDFYKFRSMHTGAENDIHKEYVQDFIKACDTNDCRDIKVFKITEDPRIFPFGKFIRKTSIDEFPQFFNVLKGDMSLVGPRPCLSYEWECYEEWHKERLKILPGCTGMWQALGRSEVTFQEMVILDLYYISNMSLWLDLKIILATIPVIFLGKGGF